MRMLSRLLAAGAFVALSAAVPAQASTTVGTQPGTSNCFPFSCFASLQGVGALYQQVYTSAAFSGTTAIDTLKFYSNSHALNPTMDSASYDLAFYLTPKPVDGLSTDAAANRGTLLSNFGSFSFGGALPSELTLNGSAFNYDPTMGNLLLQITVTGLTAAGTGGQASLSSASYTGLTSRLTVNANGAANLLPVGAVTTFMSSAVPEPATWAMMIIGFGLVGGVMRRRSTAAASFA